MDNLIDFTNITHLGMLLAGLSIGSIMGFFYGYTSDHKIKKVVIVGFVSIVGGSIGGGLYYYQITNGLSTFYIFTIFLGIGFGIVYLISVARYNKIYGMPTKTPNTQSLVELRKFGVGFKTEDGLVYEAIIKKGLTTVKDIASYCDMKTSKVQKIINKLVERKAVQGHF